MTVDLHTETAPAREGGERRERKRRGGRREGEDRRRERGRGKGMRYIYYLGIVWPYKARIRYSENSIQCSGLQLECSVMEVCICAVRAPHTKSIRSDRFFSIC